MPGLLTKVTIFAEKRVESGKWKVRANERNASLLAISQRRCGMSIGCDEENFSFPEEWRLVAL